MVSQKLKELVQKKEKTRKPIKDFVAKSKKKLKNSKDFKTLVEALMTIGIYGISVGLGLTLFGFELSFMLLLSAGLFTYIFDKKLLEMVCQILGSIKIVQVHK